MKVRTTAAVFLIGTLALAMLAGLAGTASAQGAKTNNIELSCNPGPTQIQPLGAPGAYQCTATTTFAGGVSDPINFVTVALSSPDAPSWANVIISPTSLSFQFSSDNQNEQSRPFTVSVALTQDAPAFQTQRITLTGAPAQANDVENVNVLPTQIPVTPGYFNLYNVRVDQKIGKAGPQDSFTYPIIIDNFSNGDTRFEFNLATENPPADFQPVIPEPLVLQSKATGGQTTSGQVSFQVYTPYRNGYVNDIGAMQLRVDSFYAPNTNIKGASSQVSTLTQARGFYVPGFEAPLMVLGLLGAAVVVGRTNGLRDE